MSNTEVSGYHWLARGETSADTCASSSVSSAIRKGSYIGTDCFKLALAKNVCNYFASLVLSDQLLDDAINYIIYEMVNFRVKRKYNINQVFFLYIFSNVEFYMKWNSFRSHEQSSKRSI